MYSCLQARLSMLGTYGTEAVFVNELVPRLYTGMLIIFYADNVHSPELGCESHRS